MSTFSVVVSGAPYSSQAPVSALNFCRAVLESGHSIRRLFFYDDGVLNASALVVAPQDEVDIPRSWSRLIEEYRIDAVVCVSSALKRGILDTKEADRYDLPAGNMLPCFSISGLGQLLDADLSSDRTIHFPS